MKRKHIFTVRPRALFNCTTCGACCCTSVEMRLNDCVPRKLVEMRADGTWQMRSTILGEAPTGYRCAALSGKVGSSVTCTIYPDRPAVCREVQAGGPMCLSARALFGLEGGEMDPEIFGEAVNRLLKR